MPFDLQRTRTLLQSCGLPKLFVEELGWEPRRQKLALRAGEQDYAFTALAEKRGFTAWLCESPQGVLPDYATRLKLDRKLSETSFEHLIVFVTGDRSSQSWMWVRREQGKPLAARTHDYHRGQPGDSLLQKLQILYISLEEEEAGLSTVAVAGRARAAFDIERVTKRFYERFQKEHATFLKFIDGITAVADRQWYASIMLNRLMFVYFIQRKGFLDGDHNYLRNRLKHVQQKQGKDKFLSFYRYFLIRLMHEGLGRSKEQRKLDQGFATLLGNVPYLNGGIFEQHQLELAHPDIDIPDKAFEAIFDFFDEYQWHLDERALRNDQEINPDVLGYIFEKYINQKQMGAYYTREDITEYIAKYVVLPFIFDKACNDPKHGCANAFKPESALWRLLRDNPDRYIYTAVRQGVIDEQGKIIKLPPEIEAGIADVSMRTGWNKPAAALYALPTETWREHVARRQHCLELRRKLAAGEVTQINDLITLNLDIRQFAQDVIENCEGPELLRALYHAIFTVTILDPTCGSGAFLFAALNILEPLYEACLDRMERFIADAETVTEGKAGKEPTKAQQVVYDDFRRILAEVANHPNERYFIFKSIILNNLFGVDIMEEAVEICRLRLFLKLVAQVEPDAAKPNLGVEPLPDIDFNIRAGNTLVGFTTIEAIEKSQESKESIGMLGADREIEEIVTQAASIDAMFSVFRKMQTGVKPDSTQLAVSKTALRDTTRNLNNRLDRYLADGVYRIFGNKGFDAKKFEAWRRSHQPFHWITEFYGIMRDGGFDAIIGNPPYVEYSEVKSTYTITGYRTEECGNLYAFMWERCLGIGGTTGRVGLIVPVASVCTDGYASLQTLLQQTGATVVSSFNDRPSKLFDGLEHIRLAIILNQKNTRPGQIYATTYNKWQSVERPVLFQRLAYVETTDLNHAGAVAKIGSAIEGGILRKVNTNAECLADFKTPNGRFDILYTRKLSHFVQILDFVPSIKDAKGRKRPPTELKEVHLPTAEHRDVFLSLLNSTLFCWLLAVYSDCRNLNRREIEGVRFDYPKVSQSIVRQLGTLARRLMEDIRVNTKHLKMSYKKLGTLTIQCTYPKLSKPIIDEIDAVLAKHYGFTPEELDFIINYDIKYRMGGSSRDGEDENESELLRHLR